MRRKFYDTTRKFKRISIFSGKRWQEGLSFVADWCGDCRYIYPALPEIEETNPEFTFIRVDRDQYMDLAKLWDVYGIPSLVVLEKDKEIGRFVNRDRKSKQQINDF